MAGAGLFDTFESSSEYCHSDDGSTGNVQSALDAQHEMFKTAQVLHEQTFKTLQQDAVEKLKTAQAICYEKFKTFQQEHLVTMEDRITDRVTVAVAKNVNRMFYAIMIAHIIMTIAFVGMSCMVYNHQLTAVVHHTTNIPTCHCPVTEPVAEPFTKTTALSCDGTGDGTVHRHEG